VTHSHAKWSVKPHLKQAPPLQLPGAGAFCEVGAIGQGLAACSSETIAAHWVEVLAAETSAFGRSTVVLESSVTVSGTQGATLALAFVADSSVVA
jgi:hypothetical protein